MSKLILFNKPFQVLCQFRRNDDRKTLADFIPIPEVNAAGRLDYDSEGLLLLTDDGALNHQLAHPKFNKIKKYWVQVEGQVTDVAIKNLCQGVVLKDGKTKPAIVKRIDAPNVWDRVPPIRERKQIPTDWLQIEISEGKNRQVRRMTAHVGFPTLRLIRVAIGDWSIDNLQPGTYKELEVEPPKQKKTGSKSRFNSSKPISKRSDRSPLRNQPGRSRSRKA